MFTLYGNGQARSFRVLWALEEANVEYIYHTVNFGSGDGPLGALSEEYKKINFQGKVPTCVDGDTVLTESAAIINYIAALYPEEKLAPLDDVKLRSRYDEVCFFVLSDLEQPLWSNGKHQFALPEERRVPEVLNTTRWEFTQSLRALEQFLQGKKYIVGSSFSMADILVAHTLNWAINFNFEMPVELQEYKDRMYGRHACKRAYKASLVVDD